jgi:hypothetical protein
VAARRFYSCRIDSHLHLSLLSHFSLIFFGSPPASMFVFFPSQRLWETLVYYIKGFKADSCSFLWENRSQVGSIACRHCVVNHVSYLGAIIDGAKGMKGNRVV